MIEERIAIMTIDGNMTEAQAEASLIDSGFYHEAIEIVTHMHTAECASGLEMAN
jgi:hypothetical protein